VRGFHAHPNVACTASSAPILIKLGNFRDRDEQGRCRIVSFLLGLLVESSWNAVLNEFARHQPMFGVKEQRE
jgi:hypothetical protein